MKTIHALFISAALLAPSAAFAAQNEVYTGVGTDGFTLGYAYHITPQFNVRGEYNGFKYDKDFSTDSVDYQAELKNESFGILGDWFPFDNSGFRVTAGALFGKFEVSGIAKANKNTQIKINNRWYDAKNERLESTVKLPDFRPYIGVGYGHMSSKEEGFTFNADIGVMHGSPDVELKASAKLNQAINMVDKNALNAEKSRIEKELDALELYPIIKIGIGYRF